MVTIIRIYSTSVQDELRASVIMVRGLFKSLVYEQYSSCLSKHRLSHIILCYVTKYNNRLKTWHDKMKMCRDITYIVQDVSSAINADYLNRALCI